MHVAEDLLLLLTDDDTGKLAASSTQVDVALGGALLIELTLTERVDIAGPGERVRESRLVVRDPSPTGDGLLDEALATIGHKEGKKPHSVVAALGNRTRVELYERLTDGGLLGPEQGRVLGILPSHRWPSEDAGHEAADQAGLVTALRRGMTNSCGTGALVFLLLARDVVHKAVAPDSVGLSKREMNANASGSPRGIGRRRPSGRQSTARTQPSPQRPRQPWYLETAVKSWQTLTSYTHGRRRQSRAENTS